MTPSEAPGEAVDDPVYGYKPSLLGAPWEFRLRPDALEWQAGRHQGGIPYGRVARVRLSLTRPGPSRLVVSLQMKSGIERALRNHVPELRGVEAINLPPYTVLGWDQPGFTPVELPQKDGS